MCLRITYFYSMEIYDLYFSGKINHDRFSVNIHHSTKYKIP